MVVAAVVVGGLTSGVAALVRASIGALVLGGVLALIALLVWLPLPERLTGRRTGSDATTSSTPPTLGASAVRSGAFETVGVGSGRVQVAERSDRPALRCLPGGRSDECRTRDQACTAPDL